MKTNKLLIGVVLLLGACSQDRMDIPQMPESAEPVSVNVKAIENYLSRTRRGLTRGDNYTLTPYIVEGDTVMYIANYGEGWEVFSNDTRVPMVLMKSETGSFYPNAMTNETPFENLFQNTVVYLHELNNESPLPTDTINGEWVAHGINPSGEPEPETRTEYYWKYIGTSKPHETHYTNTPTGGRLKTKWNQDGNYAQYTPTILGVPTLVGCVGVAMGQYFYFTHYRNNIPSTAITDATPYGNTYLFTGGSQTVWDSFNSTPDLSNDREYMKPTAIFLGWVSKCIDTQYGVYQSTALTFSESNMEFFMNQTHLNITVSPYSESSVSSILQRGYPVLISARPYNQEVTHVWLIDYYESHHTSYLEYYVYVPRIEGGNPDEEDEQEPQEEITEQDIREMYGDVPLEEKHRSYSSRYLMFNWGRGGAGDNVLYSASVLSWSVNSSTYNTDHYIYNF